MKKFVFLTEKYKVIFGIIFVFFLVYETSSESTVLLKLSVEQLTAESSAIAVGEITGISCSWRSDQTTIETTAIFNVEKCIRGDCHSEMKIMHRGGTVGDKTLYIPGMPQFKVGKKYLLFLRHDPEGREGVWSVVGMCQGVFEIEVKVEKSKKQIYAIQQGGAALAEPGHDGKISIISQYKPLRMLLNQLMAIIKRAIATKSPEEKNK